MDKVEGRTLRSGLHGYCLDLERKVVNSWHNNLPMVYQVPDPRNTTAEWLLMYTTWNDVNSAMDYDVDDFSRNTDYALVIIDTDYGYSKGKYNLISYRKMGKKCQMKSIKIALGVMVGREIDSRAAKKEEEK